MDIESHIAISKLEVWLHIPATEANPEGVSVFVPPEKIKAQREAIAAEANEIDLPNILQCVMQGLCDERFAKYRIVATVPGATE